MVSLKNKGRLSLLNQTNNIKMCFDAQGKEVGKKKERVVA